MESKKNELPNEILFDILSQLPIRSLLRCSCVCKTWHKIIVDPQFASAHLSRWISNPSIIFWTRTYSFRNQLHFVESDTSEICNEISCFPMFRDSQSIPMLDFVGSCHGLICFFDSKCTDSVPVYVGNPFTGQYKALPRSSIQRRYPTPTPVLGFGFASNTKEYKVVKMIPGKFNGVYTSQVEVYTLSTGFWRSKGTIPYQLYCEYRSYTFVNGALHWISVECDQIVSFDLGDEGFREIPHPEFSPINDSRGIIDVGVTWGCLSIHSSSYRGCIEIWMMKDYGVKESWSKYFAVSGYLPLYIFRNDHLILEHWSGKLVTYDVGSQMFTDLQIHGVPKFGLAYPHVASLITLESVFGGRWAEGNRGKKDQG